MKQGGITIGALPDYLENNLKIIFIGYNPGERSASVRHHYAGYGNQFWKLLFESGLTSKLYKADEDSLLLKEGYGLTNIIERSSKSSSDLSSKEMKSGAKVLREKIIKFKPIVACFLGKEIYRQYAGLKSGIEIPYGLIEKSNVSPFTRDYVAYNPSGRSFVPYQEKLMVFQDLKKLFLQ
ncbi:MAG: mismatch-specific DNA-glycosylase [Ignavibacteriales bacterium]